MEATWTDSELAMAEHLGLDASKMKCEDPRLQRKPLSEAERDRLRRKNWTGEPDGGDDPA